MQTSIASSALFLWKEDEKFVLWLSVVLVFRVDGAIIIVSGFQSWGRRIVIKSPGIKRLQMSDYFMRFIIWGYLEKPYNNEIFLEIRIKIYFKKKVRVHNFVELYIYI